MKVLVDGVAKGTVLKTDSPINFLGTINRETGRISDRNHELYGQSIKDTMLVFPSGAGSSVGAYTICSIKANGVAPLAMICKKSDLTVATGCAVAGIPCVIIAADRFESLRTGSRITLTATRGVGDSSIKEE